MTDSERREAARQFSQKWANKGREDEDDRSFWIDFLQDVIGLDHVTDRIEFQKKVLNNKGTLSNRIDAYIPETRVLIEQKTLGIDLSKPQQGHGGKTPYEQAKDYDNALPVSEKSKWIIVSNFAEIWIYDMDARVPEPVKVMLSELPNKYSLFEFLADKKQQKITQEMEVSVKAGEFVGLIYDALLKQYKDPSSEASLKSLNMLCVRLVFCLYAEDAHIFGDSGHMFHDYMEQFATKDMRKALIELFKVLDTPEDERDPYDESDLSKFPYVNGGLFADEKIEIPNFTNEIRTILLAKASEEFDWSQISPTIFGAVFESTLNPETRRSGGMHYTSIENIHKVIDPLFLDDLMNELDEIKNIQVFRTKKNKLKVFQNKLASLTWFDPACGSGNFLTETYLSIRRLENEVLKAISQEQIGMWFADDEESSSPIKVSISQFYGIEINDFAVTVAKTALWIAESQMLKETEDILLMHLDFLPLKTNAYIHEGNALRIDWNEIIPKEKLSYCMGNPPFRGHRLRTKAQSQDMEIMKAVPKYGKVDFVGAWFFKAAEYAQNSNIKIAFVATNSICQGESVGTLWKYLTTQLNIEIQYAYRTFVWESEASDQAAVHCVIVGFTTKKNTNKKIIYNEENQQVVQHINAYIQDAPDIFLESRGKVITPGLPKMVKGNEATDGGNLSLTVDERNEIIKSYPQAERFIKLYVGSAEFINNKKRYCLWLQGINPSEYRNIKPIKERLEKVRDFRANNITEAVHKLANTPMLFAQIRQPETDFLLVPTVSSQRRRYIPMGFMNKDIIVNPKVLIVPQATLFLFGVLESNVHMAWMRVVTGRLKSDYEYYPSVYNNFPWPSPTPEQKAKIEKTAQGILDARALYPDCSLADLYDPLTMPPELQKAHAANDRAVMQAYGFDVKTTSESDCVAKLMQMYQDLVGE